MIVIFVLGGDIIILHLDGEGNRESLSATKSKIQFMIAPARGDFDSKMFPNITENGTASTRGYTTLDFIASELGNDVASKLPKWTDIVKIYGEESYIIGMDTCNEFRNTVPENKAFIGVAGIFNTGTNLMGDLLNENCVLEGRIKKGLGPGMRYQVPWGKHSPASFRLQHLASQGSKSVIQKNVLPIVTIKDPLTWMSSMCRHHYQTNWIHSSEHCPNVVPNDADRRLKGFKEENGAIPVRVRYNETYFTSHSSLVGLWNDWYTAYHRAKFPRLIVRYEDLLFRPEEMTRKICTCGGGKMKKKFKYIVQSSKGDSGVHKASSGLVQAISRYGNATVRLANFIKEDLEYAKEELSQNLMQSFHYSVSI